MYLNKDKLMVKYRKTKITAITTLKTLLTSLIKKAIKLEALAVMNIKKHKVAIEK